MWRRHQKVAPTRRISEVPSPWICGRVLPHAETSKPSKKPPERSLGTCWATFRTIVITKVLVLATRSINLAYALGTTLQMTCLLQLINVNSSKRAKMLLLQGRMFSAQPSLRRERTNRSEEGLSWVAANAPSTNLKELLQYLIVTKIIRKIMA